MNTTFGQRPGDPAGWERLAPGVARRRLPGCGLDVTVGVVVGAERVLVIDTGSTPREGEEVRRQASALAGGRDVTDVALTHGHFDHALGAAAFPQARVHAVRVPRDAAALCAEAISYGVAPAEAEAAARALARTADRVADRPPGPGAPPDPGAAVLPPVDRERELDLGGGRRVRLVHPGPGHTDHDLVVVVPGAPCVVFCGDLVEESGEPQAGPDAVPGAWPAALDRLLRLGGPAARYVPGHGAVVDAAFVARQRTGLAARFRAG